MQRIGLFGGTFNPIHNGHLHLASEMLDYHALDEIWFCPAQINPFKEEQDTVSIDHRVHMIELAIEENPHFSLLDFEAKRKGISYTVDTLREIIAWHKAIGDPKEFFLILGEDAVERFLDWRDPLKIVEMVPLLVGKRGEGASLSRLHAEPKILEAVTKGMTPTTKIQVSSTEIRERLHQGLDCRELLPKKILDYVIANRLYTN